MNKTLFDAIASYGKKYREKHLSGIDTNKLINDFWPALDFFLSRACFQGRRDEVSDKVYEAVIEVLGPEFSVSKGTANYEALGQQKWKPLEKTLRSKIGKGHVGKARDVDMVLTTLDFIGQLSDLNIVKYSVGQVQHGNLHGHYVELQASQSKKGITQVGPKIAALYLRDLVSLYDLDNRVSNDDAYCIQPIDTWVRKLAYRLQIVDKEASDLKIQKAIVDLCTSRGASPILFNQGAWYVGRYASEIVLEMLDTGE